MDRRIFLQQVWPACPSELHPSWNSFTWAGFSGQFQPPVFVCRLFQRLLQPGNKHFSALGFRLQTWIKQHVKITLSVYFNGVGAPDGWGLLHWDNLDSDNHNYVIFKTSWHSLYGSVWSRPLGTTSTIKQMLTIICNPCLPHICPAQDQMEIWGDMKADCIPAVRKNTNRCCIPLVKTKKREKMWRQKAFYTPATPVC